jgi:spore germination protein GerM
MKQNLILLISLVILGGLFSFPIFGQRATSFEIKNVQSVVIGGELYVKIGGKNRKIANEAVDVWIINNGQQVVYSAADGSGGFENEGQSLRIYEVKTGKTKKILSEYTMVSGLTSVKLSNGANALLVRLSDGGLGASYFAVVDPKRGQVLSVDWAEITEIKGDTVKLAFYKEEDWEEINQKRDWKNDHKKAIPEPTVVKPEKTETLDLKAVLKNKVIVNKNSYEASEEPKLRDVEIYLWRANDDDGTKTFVLKPVLRSVDAAAPLRPALEELFKGAYESEEKDGFGSSTFGMKFEGVVLKNGVATVKFSQPPNETNYGTLGAFIFLEAILKTAKQFPTVKKVEVCAIGETLIDAQLEQQFPRCK